MAIIVSRDGKNAAKLAESPIDKEQYLQNYVAENPDSLPLDEIKETIQLMSVGREFSTTGGRIDVLAVDRDGDLYIVETKLYKNPDKRLVVAQALDYGASLWRTYADPREFTRALDSQFGFASKVKSWFKLEDEEASLLIEAMEGNLHAGTIKYVILMNRLDDRLRDLILYLNQHSNFTIYAVEMQFYRHEGLEIVIPHLFGAEAGKVPKATGATTKRGSWNPESLFENARQHLTSHEMLAFQTLYDFSTSHAQVGWGQGKEYGSISAVFPGLGAEPLYWLFSSGSLTLLFQRWGGTESEQKTRDRLRADLEAVGLGPFPNDYAARRIGVPVAEWGPKVNELVRIFAGLVQSS